MKVFFSATYQGEEEFGDKYKAIYKSIGELGYDHIDDPYLQKGYDSYLEKMKSGRDAQVENYKSKQSLIHSSDICVFETSYHSLGIGFMIMMALEAGKPTIVLYYKDNAPYFLIGSTEEKLIIYNYNDANIKQILKDSFEQARERSDKRFNFFINPKLLGYLDEESREEGVTKSMFIRGLIMDHMRKEKDEKPA
ncbi:MAG: hypothetical protein WCO06_02645 [Candidatus Roizmanbacteria bacterium]